MKRCLRYSTMTTPRWTIWCQLNSDRSLQSAKKEASLSVPCGCYKHLPSCHTIPYLLSKVVFDTELLDFSYTLQSFHFTCANTMPNNAAKVESLAVTLQSNDYSPQARRHWRTPLTVSTMKLETLSDSAWAVKQWNRQLGSRLSGMGMQLLNWKTT